MSESQSGAVGDLQRDEVKLGSNRSFGIVFAVVFSFLTAQALWRGHDRWAIFAVLAAVTLALAFLKPELLAPLNRLWHHFGLLLGKVTTPIVMGVVYYTTIVPIGIWLRLRGRDPLRLRWDAQAPSYWLTRDPAGPTPESMSRQF